MSHLANGVVQYAAKRLRAGGEADSDLADLLIEAALNLEFPEIYRASRIAGSAKVEDFANIAKETGPSQKEERADPRRFEKFDASVHVKAEYSEDDLDRDIERLQAAFAGDLDRDIGSIESTFDGSLDLKPPINDESRITNDEFGNLRPPTSEPADVQTNAATEPPDGATAAVRHSNERDKWCCHRCEAYHSYGGELGCPSTKDRSEFSGGAPSIPGPSSLSEEGGQEDDADEQEAKFVSELPTPRGTIAEAERWQDGDPPIRVTVAAVDEGPKETRGRPSTGEVAARKVVEAPPPSNGESRMTNDESASRSDGVRNEIGLGSDAPPNPAFREEAPKPVGKQIDEKDLAKSKKKIMGKLAAMKWPATMEPQPFASLVKMLHDGATPSEAAAHLQLDGSRIGPFVFSAKKFIDYFQSLGQASCTAVFWEAFDEVAAERA